MNTASYYTSQRKKLLNDLDKVIKRMRPDLNERYGETTAGILRQDALAEYEKLIPQFPYIGGKDNPLTKNLVQAAWGLALYRALQAQGGTVEDVGELLHLGYTQIMHRIPRFLRRWLGRRKFSPRQIQKMKARARVSQQRRYPGDWVYEVIEGDGQTFDVGMDYTECGIVKFMQQQDAEELMPYLCNLDYVSFGAIGMELIRTKTLGWGCDCCDFRIKKNGTPPPAWPPQFVERTCGQGTSS